MSKPVIWSPVTSNLVESSVWDEPYFVRVLWTSMLAVKDRKFQVYGSAYNFIRRFNMPMEDIQKGLKILSSPDKKRPGQPFEGRRIQEVEPDVWFILNSEKYRKLIGEAKQKEAKRVYAEKKRAEVKATAEVNGESGRINTPPRGGCDVHGPFPDPDGQPTEQEP